MKLSLIYLTALLPLSSAFSPIATGKSVLASTNNENPVTYSVSYPLFAQEEGKASDSVFLSPENEEVNEDVAFSKAEMLGRGAAKVSKVSQSLLRRLHIVVLLPRRKKNI
jgi:hypothetical protein